MKFFFMTFEGTLLMVWNGFKDNIYVEINGGDINGVFLHDLIKIMEGDSVRGDTFHAYRNTVPTSKNQFCILCLPFKCVFSWES